MSERAGADRLPPYGHEGDVTPVGEGMGELRTHYGPGYRIYFHQHCSTVVILLCGGDTDSQPRGIKLAKQLLVEWNE